MARRQLASTCAPAAPLVVVWEDGDGRRTGRKEELRLNGALLAVGWRPSSSEGALMLQQRPHRRVALSVYPGTARRRQSFKEARHILPYPPRRPTPARFIGLPPAGYRTHKGGWIGPHPALDTPHL